MEGLPRALNYELSHDLHFNHFDAGEAAQQILVDSSSKNLANNDIVASTPTITTLDALANSEFLKKIGATILNSIQLKHQQHQQQQQQQQQQHHHQQQFEHLLNGSDSSMDFDLNLASHSNQVVLDSSSVDQLQQQLEYDKFMNEVWIGIVFTLILISMVFCICSCFLYHQFRTWKRNYHNNANISSTQCTIVDIEALKLHPDIEDPVPEYTLVSGLPSYEAALELLHKTPQSKCLIVYPSVFNVFNQQQQQQQQPLQQPLQQQQQQQQQQQSTTTTVAIEAMPQTPSLSEATIPLLATTMPVANPTTTTTTQQPSECNSPSSDGEGIPMIKPNGLVMMPIVPSYAEIFGNSSYKTIDEKRRTKSKDHQLKDKC